MNHGKLSELSVADGDTFSTIRFAVESEPQAPGTDEDLHRSFAKSACSKLWYKNGTIYERPYVNISKSEIFIRLSPGVTGAYLRHVASGGIRFFGAGPHNIEPGGYVLSLQGTTYQNPQITACLWYN